MRKGETMSDENNWNEYSRLVLKELETLANGIEGLRVELQEVKQELAKLQVKEDKVDELKAWKNKIDEIVSPTQLKTTIKEVEDLKLFKTKAVTIFTVVQFMMAAIMWALNVFK
jgi:predicted TIM-barrel fold metal-dependent hydrolase